MQKIASVRQGFLRWMIAISAAMLVQAGVSRVAAAEDDRPTHLDSLCAVLDLKLMQWLDDAPVAEHIPSLVRVTAAQYQFRARAHCRAGRIEKAIDRFEIALALMGEPKVARTLYALRAKEE